MEISLLPKNALKLKGKKASFVCNSEEKLEGYNAALFFSSIPSYVGEVVKIAGAGDFEVGGIKIVGIRSEEDILYSMNIDDVSLLIGKIKSLERMQHKLKEHTVVVVFGDVVGDATFATSLGTNAVVFYGDKANEIVHAYAKENVQEMNKFVTAIDKLPAEMQTILLQ